MSDKFLRYKGKYRIPSNRMNGWDYRLPGYYLVTICTKNRITWFGKIKNGELILSAAGKIATQELQNTPKIRPNLILDAWIIMPNHIHAVIVIAEEPAASVETPRRGVSTKGNWKSGALGVIVNQYKSLCTKRIRAAGLPDFTWQARYYDHIIRNERELENIRKYILGNPPKWEQDEYYSPLSPIP
jgi:putative transposase